MLLKMIDIPTVKHSAFIWAIVGRQIQKVMHIKIRASQNY